jgi:hypothetical protein
VGYRSEVCISVEKETFETKGKDIQKHLFDCTSITLHKNTYYLYWSDVKWYEDYPETQAIQTFINDNFDMITFLRIGEETKDIEIEGCHYDSDAGVYREIRFPKGKKINLEKLFKEKYDSNGVARLRCKNGIVVKKENTREKEKSN